MPESYDVVIVGAGLAGLTAGLVGARFGLNVVVVDQGATGGQVLNVEKIENYPGFPEGIAGFDLGPLVMDQAAAAGASFEMDSVTGLEPNTAWLRDVVDLDSAGHIVTDLHLHTSTPGVFAAGDIRQGSARLLAAAAGDAATAAANAFRYLKGA